MLSVSAVPVVGLDGVLAEALDSPGSSVSMATKRNKNSEQLHAQKDISCISSANFAVKKLIS